MSKKLALEDIRKRGMEKGFVLLSNIYINALYKLKWQCPKGHLIEKKFNNIDQGTGCSVCKGNKKHTLLMVISRALKNGFKYIDGDYKNNKSKLIWSCVNKHITRKTFSDIEQGKGCSVCSGLERKTIEQVREIGRQYNFELLADVYLNSNQKLPWMCIKGHVTKKPFSKVQSGSGCNVCSFKHDKAQLELYNYVKEKYPDSLYNKSGILKSKKLQLDIYIPSLKKAIELDGEYWHSRPEARERDARKDKECQELGIALLRIGYYRDWYNNEKTAKEIINSFLAT